MFFPLAVAIFASGDMAYGSNYDEEEDEGETMTFEITKPTTDRGYNFPEKVRYSYAVNDGSAKAGEDYNVSGNRTGKIVFPEGSGTTASIKIELLEDDVDEGNGETLNLVLTTPQYEITSGTWLYGFYLPTPLTFTGLIRDPD